MFASWHSFGYSCCLCIPVVIFVAKTSLLYLLYSHLCGYIIVVCTALCSICCQDISVVLRFVQTLCLLSRYPSSCVCYVDIFVVMFVLCKSLCFCLLSRHPVGYISCLEILLVLSVHPCGYICYLDISDVFVVGISLWIYLLSRHPCGFNCCLYIPVVVFVVCTPL